MPLLTMTLVQWQTANFILRQIAGYIADYNAVNGLSDEDCDKYMAEERVIKKDQREELDELG